MSRDIAIGVPDQPRFPRPQKSGEVKLTALAELMYVYPDANACYEVARISSRRVSALSSFVFSARASSLTRICLALASMRFSPAERPRSRSRRQRSRTTSATLFTSPEASLSRLALYRRDQFVGSSV